MTPASGSKPVVTILILGLATLAGGQFWILTESLLLGAVVGALALAFLSWFAKGWGKRAERRRRVVGEIVGEIDEEDFTRPVNAGRIAEKRLRRKVERQPDQVADSIRALLVKDKPSKRI